MVNADTDGGHLRVEILGPDFEPYPGFSADECTPIAQPNQIWHQARWQGDLRTLWNKPVRLVFHLAQAGLYSFEFGI